MQKKYLSLLFATLLLCSSTATFGIPRAEKVEFKLLSQFKIREPKVNLYITNEELKQIKINEQRKIDEENERQRVLFEQQRISNLGKRVKFHVTYYTNASNSLQGGHKDKIKNLLTSYDYPIIALPSDVNYGAKVTFDEIVNGNSEYINVDTGGAIVWLNDEKTECKADVFIPNVSVSWIIRNLENKIVYGYIK